MNTGSNSFTNRPRLGASLAGIGSKSYTYDSLGQLTHQTDGWGSYQYQYDAVGQLLSSISPLSQERFAFDPAHNLVPVGSSGPTTNQLGADPINQGASSQGLVDDFGRLTVYEDKRYTYDAHGRLLSKRIGKHTHLQLHWNAEHQLIQSQRLDPQIDCGQVKIQSRHSR